jgi:hypothetical protein
MFINLKTDPRILHSSPHHACVNLPPIAFGLPLMSTLGLLLTSMLGHSSDSHSHPHSNTTQTPTHICTRTLLELPLTSALGRYSDSCSRPCSDSTRNSALAVLSIHLSEILICLTAIPYSRIPTPLGALCLSALRILRTPLGGLLRRPLGHLCLIPSYKFKPAPSDPIRTSILVRVTIRILVIQLCSDIHLGIHSDICVSLHLTSLSPCPQGPLGPPSLSALRVPRGSKPLVTKTLGFENPHDDSSS